MDDSYATADMDDSYTIANMGDSYTTADPSAVVKYNSLVAYQVAPLVIMIYDFTFNGFY